MIISSYESLLVSIDKCICMLPLTDNSTVAVNFANQGKNGSHTGITSRNVAMNLGDKVAYYDGTNDYSNLYNCLNGVIDWNEWSFSIWARMDAGVSTDGADHAIFQFGNGAVGDEFFRLKKDDTNERLVLNYVADGGSLSLLGGVLTDNETWFNIIFTFDGDGDMALYYNNVVVVSGASPDTFNFTPTANQIAIGAQNTTPINPWKGHLAYCAIWNKILSETERGLIYNGGLG